jgi:hypothetical protein
VATLLELVKEAETSWTVVENGNDIKVMRKEVRGGTTGRRECA